MNKHLQNLLEIIQQDNSMSADQKNAALKSLKDADKELEITAFKLDKTEKVKQTTAVLLEETIAELEQKRKESQIELALERVRARTMAMHRSEELGDVATVLFQQVKELGIHAWSTGFNIWLEGNDAYIDWIASPSGGFVEPYTVDLTTHPAFRAVSDAKKSGEEFHVFEMSGKPLQEAYALLMSFAPKQFEGFKTSGFSFPTQQFNHYVFGSKVSLMFITPEPHPEAHDVFKRFGKVFEQTYTRFLDLQKAEAQTREAKIEAALEKVRSRSLAMHKTEELKEVITVVFEKLLELGVPMDGGAHISIYNDEAKGMTNWLASPDFIAEPMKFYLPYYESPVLSDFWKARPTGVEYLSKVYPYEVKSKFYNYIFIHTDYKDVPQNVKELITLSQSYAYSGAFSKYSGIVIHSHFGKILSEPDGEILKRFAKVFEQAYTRFLDLQKAEAQTREALIEASLERVRAKTMAMHSSQDVTAATETMFDELKKLGSDNLRCGMANIHTNRTMDVFGITTLDGGSKMTGFGLFGMDEHPIWQRLFDSWLNKEDFVCFLAGKEKEEYFKNIDSHRGYLPRQLVDFPDNYFHCYYFDQGIVWAYSLQPHSESDSEIMKRFATVFSLTYRRYQDLRKAEAQAREAQIEVSLERVRASTMAMHNSEDVVNATSVMFTELHKLGIKTMRCGILIFEENQTFEVWSVTNKDGGKTIRSAGSFNVNDHPAWQGLFRVWNQKEEFYYYYLAGEDKKNYYRILTNTPNYLSEPIAELPDQHFQGYNFPEGTIWTFSVNPHSEEDKQVLKKFTAVFSLTFRRYQDLKKAEAQAREAQIEASLERVRSRTMAMHNSEDVVEATSVVFMELHRLGIETLRCGILLIDESKTMEVWSTTRAKEGQPAKIIGRLDMTIHPSLAGLFHAWKIKEEWYEYHLRGQDRINYYQTLSSIPGYQSWSQFMNDPDHSLHACIFNAGALYVFAVNPLSSEDRGVMKRFTVAFSQTFLRYRDLQKAEAQTHEAQIEAALERVRAASMAMHKSQELHEVIKVISEQLINLGLKFDSTNFIRVLEDGRWDTWISTPVQTYPALINMPYIDLVSVNEINTTIRQGGELISSYSKEVKDAFFHHFFTNSAARDIPDQRKEYVMNSPGWAISIFIAKNIGLAISNYQGIHFSETDNDLIRRFAKVFEQSYTRFLDLQKAEAQAIEGQIEVALERVRSRSMAMHKSEELREVIQLVFDQLQQLNFNIDSAQFDLNFRESDDINIWTAVPGQPYSTRQHIPYFDNAVFNSIKKAKEAGLSLSAANYTFEEKNEFFNYFFKYADVPEERQKFVLSSPGFARSAVFLDNIYLGIQNYSGVPYSEAEHAVLRRFAKVFEQTYIRFLDLQKAESQVREATIEASLERVRASAMAMHKSEDVGSATLLMFDQLRVLEVTPQRCGIAIPVNTDTIEYWAATTDENGKSVRVIGNESIHLHPALEKAHSTWLKKEEFGTYYFEWDDLVAYQEALAHTTAFPEGTDAYAARGKKAHLAFFPFTDGWIYLFTSEGLSESSQRLLVRFARVFDLTYRRYLDLRKAEAQAVEAIKRASVDRIRAEIASMRTTSDLQRITPLIWSELKTLGIPFIRCGVFIMDEELRQVHTFLSTPDGKAIATLHTPFDFDLSLTLNAIAHWRDKKLYIEHWDAAKFVQSWIKLSTLSEAAVSSAQTDAPPENLYLHMLPFLQGMLYVGNVEPLTEEMIHLLESVAEAFSTAYARYEDFNKLEAANSKIEKTLVDLKQTQTQLVQSEKMASLGELTAGIAHEIQNPLNFVNNFSEVNKELLAEMNEAIQNGAFDEAKVLAKDIIDNSEKINHHGKRADVIVKGMLQHSRASTGQKEPTDINVLADEYLRLAYHGLRAKDKSFNATTKTDFDSSIGTVNIIPQDIGRVILNLITNAFYAVNKKKSLNQAGYEPTVTVTTSTKNGKVEIRVTDNGIGIPPSIKDKIFQPFFTTKPTGQGTGLGLSMSYDIVKAHGGELKVETKEGNGSEFIVQLPI